MDVLTHDKQEKYSEIKYVKKKKMKKCLNHSLERHTVFQENGDKK